MRTENHGFTVGYYQSPLRGSKQNVRRDSIAQRASWCFSDFANVINAALLAPGNFTRTVKFDVRRQVVGEMYGIAIG